MNTTAGIIFSNLHDRQLSELTHKRTVGAIPFACRYRLVDFPISAMANSGIENIYVIAHNNYHSLAEHIGSGKDYDLARHSGGIHILTPLMNAYTLSALRREESYDSRLCALTSIIHTLEVAKEEYIIMCDCNSVYNIDFSDIVTYHSAGGYDLTLVEGIGDRAPFICAVRRKVLTEIIKEALEKGLGSFTGDVVKNNALCLKIGYYVTTEPFLTINSIGDYYSCNMEVVRNRELRRHIFSDPLSPIFTRLHNPPPARYSAAATVRNSLIADGCEIQGTVINSVIFRKVKIGKDAVISDSIVLEQTEIEDGANLRCVIADKGSIIKKQVMLVSDESLPVYILPGKVVGQP